MEYLNDLMKNNYDGFSISENDSEYKSETIKNIKGGKYDFVPKAGFPPIYICHNNENNENSNEKDKNTTLKRQNININMISLDDILKNQK